MVEKQQGRAAYNAVDSEYAIAEMNSMGISAFSIGLLVDTFYARVLTHSELGPVFDAKIAGRWPDHMEKMKSFWSAVALRNGGYGGKPIQAHLGVANMTPELFSQWLALFAATVDDVFPTEEARTWFKTAAARIARSLTLTLFYNPALDDPRLKRIDTPHSDSLA